MREVVSDETQEVGNIATIRVLKTDTRLEVGTTQDCISLIPEGFVSGSVVSWAIPSEAVYEVGVGGGVVG